MSLESRLKNLENAFAGMPSAAESQAAFAALVSRDLNEIEMIYGSGKLGTRSLTYSEALAAEAEEEAEFRQVYGESAGRLYR